MGLALWNISYDKTRENKKEIILYLVFNNII